MKRRWTFTWWVLSLCILTAPAFAGGLRVPDNSPRALGRAGAFVAKADDLTAIYFNPAGLANLKGTQLLISGTYNKLLLDFKRAGIDPGTGAPYTSASPKQPFVPVPYFVVSSDFGLKDWTFALGLQAPSSVGSKNWPEDGPQRYSVISTAVAMVWYTASVAYRPTKNFAIGISLIWADMFKLNFKLTVDGNIKALSNPLYKSDETREFDTIVELNAKDRFNFTAIIGLWYRPVKCIDIGLSSMIAPLNFNATGTLKVHWPNTYLPLVQDGKIFLSQDGKTPSASDTIPITLSMQMPPDIRFGIRYRHLKGEREVFDIELGVFVEFWRVLEELRVTPKGGISTYGEFNELPVISIKKQYYDTISVRLGGDWNVLPFLTWRMGLFWESPAVPQAFSNVDFLNFMRFGVSTGFSFKWKWGRASAGVMYIHSPTRTISKEQTSLHQQVPFTKCAPPHTDPLTCDPGRLGIPPGNPIGAGEYKVNYILVALGFEIFIDKFF